MWRRLLFIGVSFSVANFVVLMFRHNNMAVKRYNIATEKIPLGLSRQYGWMNGLSKALQNELVSVVHDQCGHFYKGAEELAAATTAYIGSTPRPYECIIPRDHEGPWAPSTNFDPESPQLRVLFLSDISTYTRFAVRQFWHYFYAAAADHRVYARLWGYGFPGFDMEKSVLDNLKSYYGGKVFFDAVIIGEIYAAGYVRSADLRELRRHGVFTGTREHESWTDRLDMYREFNLSFFHLAYGADIPSKYQRTGFENSVISAVPHLPDYGLFSKFGSVARSFIRACIQDESSDLCSQKLEILKRTPLKEPLKNRKYDVLLSGAEHKILYPFRWKVKKSLRNKKAHPYKIIDEKHAPYVHGGSFEYDKLPNGVVKGVFPLKETAQREKMLVLHSKAMRDAIILVNGPSVFRYPLAKYMEAVAAGQVILSPLPNEIQFLRERINRISPGATASEIRSRIGEILHNLGKWEKRTTKTQCLGAAKYSAFNMVDALIATVNRLKRNEYGITFANKLFVSCAAIDRLPGYKILWSQYCTPQKIQMWTGEMPPNQVVGPGIMKDTDIVGNDLMVIKSETANACKRVCIKVPNCGGCTYTGGNCYLKKYNIAKLNSSKRTTPDALSFIKHGKSKRCYVIITNLAGWKRYVTKEYYFLFNNLIQNHGWVQGHEPALYGRFTKEKRKTFFSVCPQGDVPDFVLFTEYYGHIPSFFAEAIQWLRLHGTKIGFWANDPNVFEFRKMSHTAKLKLLSLVDVWYGPYTYSSFVFYPQLKSVWPKRVWLPNAVGIELQNISYNKMPLERVLLAGSTEQLQYPLRGWALQQVPHDKRFVHLTHPGYNAGKSSEYTLRLHEIDRIVKNLQEKKAQNTVSASLKGQNFGVFVSKFLVCFTDMMRFNSLISKHFEFAASGCLVMSSDQDLAVLESVGFKHMETFVAYDKTDPGKAISWALDPMNRKAVDTIRHAGYNLVHSYHLSQNRSSFLNKHAQYTVAKSAGCTECPITYPFSVRDEILDDACPCPIIGEDDQLCRERWKTVTFQI